ncbi:MAG: ADP-ribosylglycohydrolase family protein [Verrucomicrobia bacterium]|nr:ADP-ribosylglycohydrolase family protein [Verrucomicrobiota bacterium]
MYGALAGDALGVPVEFSDRAARDARPVTGMQGWGTWNQPPGTWSDDGSLLLCTAEGLLGEFSLPRLGALYVQWMRAGHWGARGEVFDIGGATRSSLSRLAGGSPGEASGETGEGQNGNGSLMRILPVGLRFAHDNPGAICRKAMAVSAITHAHPRSQLACAFYSCVVASLLGGTEPLAAYRAAIADIERVLGQFPRERARFARILDGRVSHLPREEVAASGYVLHTLEAALWCLLRHTDYRSTVLAAVNLGGDTDTTGCVAGGLAGLVYGWDAIPAGWIEALPRRADVEELITRFSATCGAPAMPAATHPPSQPA